MTLTLLPGTEKSGRADFLCSCGSTHNAKLSHFRSGSLRSCGKCVINTLRREVPLNKYGKLCLSPGQFIKSTYDKLRWICECGKEKEVILNSVIRGKTVSCGACNLIRLERDSKIGVFTYIGDLTLTAPRSDKVIRVKCECGNELSKSLNKVHSAKNCGKCNDRPAEWWTDRYFGKLKLSCPKYMSASSIVKEDWNCKCGVTKSIRVSHVTSGKIKSCGSCRNQVLSWLNTHTNTLNTNSEWPAGGPIPLESIRNSYSPFLAKCPLCGNEYKPRFSDIKRGLSLTCGCASARISSGAKEISDFIRSLGLSVINEYDLNGLKYDIYVPGSNLLIEYQGLKWHSGENAKNRDIKKFENANNFKFMSIFEDEWTTKSKILKSIIINKLGLSNPVPLRPKQCQLLFIDSQIADIFYENNHYIGKSYSRVNIGIFYNDKIIGSISFKKPSRQSKYDWELSRMAMDSGLRVHGVWSACLDMFIKKYGPRSIVSFSDNRLFNGLVYVKMGFTKEAVIRPDYYWVKSNKRFHKSALRKKKGIEITESALRESEGYSKIWDLGKVRWVRYF